MKTENKYKSRYYVYKVVCKRIIYIYYFEIISPVKIFIELY